MKQTIRLTIFSFIFGILTLPVMTPLVAYAALPVGDGGGSATTGCKKDSGVDVGTANPGDCTDTTAFSYGACGKTGVTISCLAAEVMRFLSALVGIAVVAGITIGGITYSTGSGNAAKTQKGVSIIINSVLGLLLFMLMFAGINFLIPGGIFQ